MFARKSRLKTIVCALMLLCAPALYAEDKNDAPSKEQVKSEKILLAAALAAAAAAASAAQYEIDPFHSNARFEIDHFGTSTNVGGIYKVTGNVHFDPAKKTGSVEAVLPLANLQSSSDEFTKHLKSADIFNAEKYPEIRFASTKFIFDGKKVSAVQGNLTLLGQTHPVVLKASKFNCYQNPMKKVEVCGGDFAATIDRTQWGADYLVSAGMAKNVKLNIQIEAAKK